VTCAEWETIVGFQSPGEYERFRDWIAGRVSDGDAEPVPVDSGWRDADSRFEDWYRCPDTGEVWSLKHPDPPFRGAFARVGY
jgi:hypothetical protein